MDVVFAFLTGFISKTYDDIFDNKIINSPKVYEILKGLSWIFFTIICYNDFNFTITFYLINMLTLLNDRDSYLKEPYEFSLVSLFPILIILSFSTRHSLTFFDIFYILFFKIVMFFEPIFFKEEYSFKKLIIRLLSSFFSIIGLIFGDFLNISTSFLKISSYAIGYGLASSIFQLYMLIQDNDKVLQAITLHNKSYGNRIRCCMVSDNRYVSNCISIRAINIGCSSIPS